MSGRPRLARSRDLRLLPRGSLVRTNELDQADWNYRPLLRWISRLRLRAVAGAISPQRSARLLEVGYGSGVLLPELARHADRVFGVDLHRKAAPVHGALAANGVDAHLATGSADHLPFPDACFDAVVVVSTLEFVPDVEAAVRELVRVTAAGGHVVAVTPGRSRILDLGLRILTGERGEDTFQGRRGLIEPAFSAVARIEHVTRLPRLVHRLLPLYAVVVATPHAPSEGASPRG